MVRPCLGVGGHQRPSHRGVRGGRRAGHWFEITGATKAAGDSLAAGSVWGVEGGGRLLMFFAWDITVNSREIYRGRLEEGRGIM